MAAFAHAQDQAATEAKGGIRGTIYDADFNVPVPQVKVSLTETNRSTATSEDGHYAIADLPPGIYTVVFAKEGFVRETRINVLVVPGAFAEVDTRLFGEYTDMDELVVSDIDLGGGTEAGLLSIRQQSMLMMDSVGSDLIGRANQSTAAGALRLVAGASVEGGKYAVVRGLGDRYTSTQINAVRLPSADPDKRAVQLDQFPSAVIESIQVSKTFLPDQQGDSGAGTINIITRSVPTTNILSFKVGTAYKPTITGNSDFRWNPRGMDYFGESDRDLPVRSAELFNINKSYSSDPGLLAGIELSSQVTKSLDPRVGTTTEAPPLDSNWGATVGDVLPLGEEWRVGGVGSFSYSSKYEGHNGGLVQKASVDPAVSPDVLPDTGYPQTESVGVEKILWGGVATVGLCKGDEQDIGLTFMGNHAADSYAQEYTYDPQGALNNVTEYREVLDYLERDFYTVQEHGCHTLPFFENWNAIPDVFSLQAPVFEWTFAQSDSLFYEPDRTTTIADQNSDGTWSSKSCQRTWTTIDEQSRQYSLNIKEPFENWTGDKGYFKAGYFHDDVNRTFNTDYLGYVYPNSGTFNTNGLFFPRNGPPSSSGPSPIWDTLYNTWLGLLPGDKFGTHVVQQSLILNQWPIDYTGEQQIRAWYTMGDLPVSSWLRVLGGVRMESTYIKPDLRVNVPSSAPEQDHTIAYITQQIENGTRVFDVFSEPDNEVGRPLEHTDVLPALGVLVKPWSEMQLRLNWSQTMARPTFKELAPVATPIQGTSDYFIGNPDLKMSSMNNYDARLEVYPSAGNLVAFSAFLKHIKDPIDRILVDVSGASPFSAFVPLNYPEATIKGMEAEVRQDLGAWLHALDGWSVGANGTLLQSELEYDQYSVAQFSKANGAIFPGDRSRPMTGQPDYLANLNCTYDIASWGTSLNLFYTFQGTTLAAGEATVPNGADGAEYIPNVYQKPYGTLSASVSQMLNANWKLTLGAKNLLRPAMTQYYDYRGSKLFRTRYTTPIEYTCGLEGKW